ncbi:MAG: cupin domain-containing protein [Acidobacteria bacterium]|nr:cupin domain-containing protein [Acidobacteriota bacterium]
MESMEFDAEIASYLSQGFRLEMIFPADAPREAVLSRDGESIRIESHRKQASDGEWHVGRAGMEYRDLIPDRLGGRVIASHIRIRNGGPIPDYVHYHRVRFQMIYCLKGSARLVYEDQGGPFEFRAGDCVLQPPEIRHRVLECSDGFEVLEVGTPAEHPTFAEHEFDLPNGRVDPERDFGGQRFLHHRFSEAIWDRDGAIEKCRLAIGTATGGLADVEVWRATGNVEMPIVNTGEFLFYFVRQGSLAFRERNSKEISRSADECFVVPKGRDSSMMIANGTEAIRIRIDPID